MPCPKALEVFNHSISFVTTLYFLVNTNIVHEKRRFIHEQALVMFIFVEHIRKLAITFLFLFKIQLGNTTFAPFSTVGYLWCLFFSTQSVRSLVIYMALCYILKVAIENTMYIWKVMQFTRELWALCMNFDN